VPSATSKIDRFVAKIRSSHRIHLPASPKDLLRLRRLGMPEDVLRFYTLSDGARLHRTDEYGGLGPDPERRWRWEILPCREIEPASQSYVGADSPLFKRAHSWMHLVNVQDGNYLAINVEPGHVGEVLDCFHETVGEPGRTAIVALSFTELLDRLLKSPRPFWLRKTMRPYGSY
jgi:antitoxin YokJ